MIANLNKTEPDTRIIDEQYNPERTHAYQLFLFAGADGLSMAIMDIESNKFIALQSFSFSQGKETEDLNTRLSQLFNTDVLLSRSDFKKISFCYAGQKSTLIPDPLFLDENAVNYLSFNFSLTASDLVHVDHLNLLGAKNVFAVPQSLELLVKEKFPLVAIHHHATAFIESLLQQNKNRDEKIITVYIHLSGFELAVTRRNELVFYNSFLYTSTEDFLYFVLFTMEQLQLNPETTPFVFTGAAERSSALYITTQKYIRNVGFGERTEHYSFAYGFENIPAHFHYVLFNQYLCES